MKIAIATMLLAFGASAQNLAVQGKTVYTMAGEPITNGVVLIENGKITKVGPAGQVAIPPNYDRRLAEVVTPGLVDAHTTVGLSGYLNIPTDQDQIERSTAIQPDLRAVDAYESTRTVNRVGSVASGKPQ